MFRTELRALLTSIRGFKVAGIELVLASIQEIKPELGQLGEELDMPPDAGWVRNLASLETFPMFLVRTTLAEPFHPLNWEAVVPRLRRVEANLAIQEHLLRSAPEFEAERPSTQFRLAKAKMFTLFICVGNLYGFTLSPAERESRLLNFGTAIFYLQKAIGLDRKPEKSRGKPPGTHIFVWQS